MATRRAVLPKEPHHPEDYAIFSVDGGGTILSANDYSGELFGTAADNLLGENVIRFVPSDRRRVHLRNMAEYRANPDRGTMGHRPIVSAVRWNGDPILLHGELNPVEGPAGLEIVCVFRRATPEEAAEVLTDVLPDKLA